MRKRKRVLNEGLARARILDANLSIVRVILSLRISLSLSLEQTIEDMMDVVEMEDPKDPLMGGLKAVMKDVKESQQKQQQLQQLQVSTRQAGSEEAMADSFEDRVRVLLSASGVETVLPFDCGRVSFIYYMGKLYTQVSLKSAQARSHLNLIFIYGYSLNINCSFPILCVTIRERQCQTIYISSRFVYA